MPPHSAVTTEASIVSAIQQITEAVVWGEKHGDEAFFEYVCEKGVFSHVFLALLSETPAAVKPLAVIQVLQSLNILVANISRDVALYYMFSNNFANTVTNRVLILLRNSLSPNHGEEVQSYLLAFLKTVSMRVTDHPSLIRFISNFEKPECLILQTAGRFATNINDHLAQTAARTTVLNFVSAFKRFAESDESTGIADGLRTIAETVSEEVTTSCTRELGVLSSSILFGKEPASQLTHSIDETCEFLADLGNTWTGVSDRVIAKAVQTVLEDPEIQRGVSAHLTLYFLRHGHEWLQSDTKKLWDLVFESIKPCLSIAMSLGTFLLGTSMESTSNDDLNQKLIKDAISELTTTIASTPNSELLLLLLKTAGPNTSAFTTELKRLASECVSGLDNAAKSPVLFSPESRASVVEVLKAVRSAESSPRSKPVVDFCGLSEKWRRLAEKTQQGAKTSIFVVERWKCLAALCGVLRPSTFNDATIKSLEGARSKKKFNVGFSTDVSKNERIGCFCYPNLTNVHSSVYVVLDHYEFCIVTPDSSKLGFGFVRYSVNVIDLTVRFDAMDDQRLVVTHLAQDGKTSTTLVLTFEDNRRSHIVHYHCEKVQKRLMGDVTSAYDSMLKLDSE